MDPLKISIMDVDDFVKRNNIQEVTSSFIKDPSTGNFDDKGLFSESIFGELASKDRLVQRGYIALNTKILHPRLYHVLIKIKSLYKDIINGLEYAIFDNELKDFVVTDTDDERAETGITFFLEHVEKLEPALTGAIRKDTSIKLFLQNKKNMFVDKLIVIPAGIRDFKNISGRDKYDDINKLYMTVINLSRTLKIKHTNSKMFDPVITALQSKINEVFSYILNIMDGKSGFIQEKYGSRGIALGTRNVISAANTAATSATSDAMLKSNEVMVPLYQFIHMYRPIIVYNLKNIFFNTIFNKDTLQASLIDKNNYKLNYYTIPLEEKNKFTASDKIIDAMHSFQDNIIKHEFVSCVTEDGELKYLYLTYKDKNNVYVVRSINELNSLVENNTIKNLDKDKIRPLTYFEMYYLAACHTGDKYSTITRFPVAGPDSIFPAKVHIATTSRYEEINLIFLSNPSLFKTYYRYPIYQSESIGSVSLHPCQLKPLTADHDGDTVSCLGLLSSEATDECKEYLNMPSSVLNTNGTPIIKVDTDMAVLTLFNLTRDINK
jgi:hypothetical protein